MQSLFTAIFSIFLVLDCILLVTLILIQLPKKEAGAGMAFGGGASDAIFGAGSGTALSRITKYLAGAFFVLAILLAVIGKPPRHSTVLDSKPAATVPAATATATTAAPEATTPAVTTPASSTATPDAKPAIEIPAASTNK